MNNTAPLIEALGWTFLHFLWQGTTIAAVLWVVLRAMAGRTAPQTRYGAAGVALALMLATTAITLWRQGIDSFSATAWHGVERMSIAAASAPASADASPAVSDPAQPTAGAFAGPRSASATPQPAGRKLSPAASQSFLPRLLPWLAGLWAVGSGLLSLRVLNGWRLTRRLRLAARAPEDASWHERFARICDRLRVSKSVRLLSTASGTVPMVIGWLKPAVLVPAALFAGLPTAHLEAILAHELAHVRRHDCLVNLLQTLVETLLFYHPAVWWVSAQLRKEREHCCDDVASAACGSPTDYARALAALEESRGAISVLGMAATGGSLLARIRRILGVRDQHVSVGAWPVGVVALVLLVAAVPLTRLGVAGQPSLSALSAQTTPATVTATNEPGRWDLGGGVTLEVRQDIEEVNDPYRRLASFKVKGPTKLVLRWAATEHRPALIYGTKTAQVFAWNDFGGVVEVPADWVARYFSATEPWAIAWEKGRPALWITPGESPRWNDPDQGAKPKATRLKILDFSDPNSITTRWMNGAPADDPSSTRVVGALRGFMEIAPDGRELSRYSQCPLQDTPGADPFASIIVTARSDGGYNIGETRCDAADLRGALKTIAGGRANLSVMIGGSSEVPFAMVTEAVTACREAGIGFSTEVSAPSPVLEFRLIADAAGTDTEPLTAPNHRNDRQGILHVKEAAILGTGDVAFASPIRNLTTGYWDIAVRLTEGGGAKLAKATKENGGAGLAIVLNGEVISAPTIRDTLGTMVMISGNLDMAAAKALVRAIETPATKDNAAPPKEILIVLEKQGVLTLNGELTDATTLIEKLEHLAEPLASEVVIRAHRDNGYVDVVRVVDLCRKAGFAVRLATEPDDKAKSGSAQPDPFSVPTDPKKFGEAVRSGIGLTVLDSKAQTPLREFRVVAGVKSSVSEGQEVVNWQPHTVHVGGAGGLIWPLDKAYDEMALRIEAEGYAPQVSKWIKKSEGAKEVSIQLVPDAGTGGHALTPDGRPAAGAMVALAMVQRDAVIEGGRLRRSGEALPEKPADRWRWPVFVTADGDGRFQLPAENDATAAVLIVHDAGVRELALTDFVKSPEVTLQPWGRLDGRVLWGEKPGADQAVSLTVHRDDYGYPGVIAQYEKATSAADGRFVFERVLPGLAQVSCPIQAGPNKSGITEINLTGQMVHVTAKPGATPVLIGGHGRTVKGRLTGRDTWDGVTFHFHPTAPHVGFPGDDEIWKAWGEFQKGPTGSLFFRDGLKVNADGTFEIANVLPEDYQISFSRAGENGPVAAGKFDVGPETPGEKPGAFDIGEFKASGGAK